MENFPAIYHMIANATVAFGDGSKRAAHVDLTWGMVLPALTLKQVDPLCTAAAVQCSQSGGNQHQNLVNSHGNMLQS